MITDSVNNRTPEKNPRKTGQECTWWTNDGHRYSKTHVQQDTLNKPNRAQSHI